MYYTFMYSDVCVCVCVCVCVFVCIYVYMCVYVCASVCVHVYLYMRMCVVVTCRLIHVYFIREILFQYFLDKRMVSTSSYQIHD